MNPVNKRFLVLAGAAVVIILVIIFGSQKNAGIKPGGEYISPDTPAFLVYKKDTYKPLSTNGANNLLAKDMAYFARTKFPAYDPEKQPGITFTLTSDPVKNNGTVEFEGKYEKVKDVIKVSVTELENNRIKTSITNTKTGTNMDSELPSNSKTNTFIGSLPVFTNDYLVYYSLTTNKITVLLYGDYNEARKAEALKVVSDALGIPYINDEHIDFYYTQPDTGQGDGQVKRSITSVRDEPLYAWRATTAIIFAR